MGEAGNNGASGIWNENKGLYKTSDGNVEIHKPEADDTYQEPNWANKCTNKYGSSISGKSSGLNFDVSNPADGASGKQPTYSGNIVRISNGSGTANPDTDTAHLEWQGSFTIVYYGGMTYWTLTNPVLDIKGWQGHYHGHGRIQGHHAYRRQRQNRGTRFRRHGLGFRPAARSWLVHPTPLRIGCLRHSGP